MKEIYHSEEKQSINKYEKQLSFVIKCVINHKKEGLNVIRKMFKL